jgi:hypothetical protein
MFFICVSPWVDEIKQYDTGPMFLLISTKSDPRQSADSPVSKAEGHQLKDEIGAFGYVECSTIKCQGVKHAFDQAILYAVNPPRRGGCCTLE